EEERKKNLEEKKDMARKMLQRGMGVEDIHTIIELPKEIIRSLLS
ncbi:MAG: hypothetical protein K0R52_28, partial [Alphaproteobacteria bacterium]|nr:hypothetical protein [Alphaproteobacteria bacterium]